MGSSWAATEAATRSKGGGQGQPQILASTSYPACACGGLTKRHGEQIGSHARTSTGVDVARWLAPSGRASRHVADGDATDRTRDR